MAVPNAYRVRAVSGLDGLGVDPYAGGCVINESKLDAFGKANGLIVLVQQHPGADTFHLLGALKPESTGLDASLVWIAGENVLRAFTSETFEKAGPVDQVGTKSYCEALDPSLWGPGPEPAQAGVGYGEAIMWALAVGVVLVTVGYAANAKWAKASL